MSGQGIRTVAVATVLALGVASGGMAQTADGTAIGEAQTLGTAEAEAQYASALRHMQGTGVLQDYGEAGRLALAAAEAGHAGAANLLAKILFEGLPGAPDHDAALVWFARAAETGNAEYIYDYAVALEGSREGLADPAKAAQFYRQAAEVGHMEARVSLAVLHQHGKGVVRDIPRAMALYKEAAEAGNARALNNLGLIYVRGHDVPQDHDLAFRLFEAAAEKGLREAVANLSVMYENGFGTAVNEAHAAELARSAARGGLEAAEAEATASFVYDPRLAAPDTTPAGLDALRQAAGAGDSIAGFMLAYVLVRQEAPDLDALREAAALFEEAAKAGIPAAMLNLGLMYYEGVALPQDFALGYMWLALAAKSGLAEAGALNTVLSERMSKGQVAEAQAMAAERVR